MVSRWSDSVPRSEKLEEGIGLLKLVPLDSFELILSKIKSKDVFTDNDIENLMESLKINEIKTKHVIETISYLNKHLSRVILKPLDLENALINDFSIEGDKAHVWTKFWTSEIGQNFNLGNMDELVNVSWELNVEAGSTLFRKDKIPTATIMLKGSRSDTLLRLNEEELTQLYNSLESIQAKLDM